MPSRLTKACTGARDVSLIMMASIARVPVMPAVRRCIAHLDSFFLRIRDTRFPLTSNPSRRINAVMRRYW
jgi:hypothetical protein